MNDFTTISIELMEKFLDEAYEHNPKTDLPLRQAFVYRQARNIADLADDVNFLEANNRTSSCFVLMRPLFESLMNLVAAVKNESFAIEKMIADIENDVDKMKKWQEYESDEEPNSFAEVIQLLENFTSTLRKENNIFSHNKWHTLDVARIAKLEHHYIKEYFMFSRNAHSSTCGIIAQENECGREMILQSTAYIVLVALGHAVQAVPCENAKEYIQEVCALMDTIIDAKEHREEPRE